MMGAQGTPGPAGEEGKRGSTGEQGASGPAGLLGPRVSWSTDVCLFCVYEVDVLQTAI